MAKRWLVKTEPGDYAAEDLERDGRAPWTGVRNPVAQKHMRAMKPGDEVFVYHSGKPKSIVAVARVASEPRDDHTDKSGKSQLVELEFDRYVPNPVPLKDIKADQRFADFALVRQSRLSVMPVTAEEWKRLLKMAGA